MPTVVVPAGLDGDLELGPHAVGAAHQHRLLVLAGEERAVEIEPKQPGKAPFQRHDARRLGPTQELGKPRHRVAVEFQIDAGILVRKFRHASNLESERRETAILGMRAEACQTALKCVATARTAACQRPVGLAD